MEVTQCLAEGRYGEALAAIRKEKRGRLSEAARLALEECAALLGLERYRDAVLVATRALGGSPKDADLKARLRVIRGEALWRSGRSKAGEQEARRGLAQAQAPHTRARALELLGGMAWRQRALEQAQEQLESAQRLYAELTSASGLFRVYGALACVLRDRGRTEEALALQERRLRLALELRRSDLSAVARAERGVALAALGHWNAARGDLDTASEILDRLTRNSSGWIEPIRAGLELAAGNLPAARAALVRAVKSSQGCPRATAEALLIRSDLELASGAIGEAENCASEALRLFAVAKDKEGTCRSRLRRGLALIEQGRCEEAVREARRVRTALAPGRCGLFGLALLVEGRALLRAGRPAARAFAGARVGVERPFRDAAELGLAVAQGGTWASAEVQQGLAALEAWGDRRLLSYALADLRATLGPQARPARSLSPRTLQRADPRARAVAEAASRLLGSGSLGERWQTAMTALHPILPWWRAVLLGPRDLELRWDLKEPRPLPAGDLARELVASATHPTLVELGRGTPFAGHPTGALHALETAVVAPAGASAFVCFDFRVLEPGPEAVALVAEVAGLVARMPYQEDGPEAGEAEGGRAEAPQFRGFIGRCQAMRELFSGIARVAASDTAVHVLGETGTGKERVAEAVHQASPRKRGPFVPVNASSLPDELFESQLFGHVKGAFTGAVGDREGYVAEAEGGTLFLDEITDLSLRAQAKLLRFLETGEYRRVGETRLHQARVRIVTASNVSLEERVQTGQLRADLLYRLKRLTLSLPPLRERGEDILLLARHLLRQVATQAGAPSPELPCEVGDALQAYGWPGNVRELRSEMERLFLWAAQGPLRRDHLSPEIRRAAEGGVRRRAASVSLPVVPLKEAVSEFERDHIGRVLGWTDGNRTHAACALGLTRQGLVAKISRLGIG